MCPSRQTSLGVLGWRAGSRGGTLRRTPGRSRPGRQKRCLRVRVLTRLPARKFARLHWLAACLRWHESCTMCRLHRVMRRKLGPSGIDVGCHTPGVDPCCCVGLSQCWAPGRMASRVSESMGIVVGQARCWMGSPGVLWPDAPWTEPDLCPLVWLVPSPSDKQFVDPADDFGRLATRAGVVPLAQGGALLS